MCSKKSEKKTLTLNQPQAVKFSTLGILPCVKHQTQKKAKYEEIYYKRLQKLTKNRF